MGPDSPPLSTAAAVRRSSSALRALSPWHRRHLAWKTGRTSVSKRGPSLPFWERRAGDWVVSSPSTSKAPGKALIPKRHLGGSCSAGIGGSWRFFAGKILAYRGLSDLLRYSLGAE